jgi:hypothetical protein
MWRDATCMDTVRRDGELEANAMCGRRRSPVVTVGRAIKGKAYPDVS